ncbi:hypothetical protein B0G73_10276 [Paraburkholderia sp. BL25I1N1]|nr:hypothetical protein B0G73_10276 [Paraburkholderia sp. BL25I1N1]
MSKREMQDTGKAAGGGAVERAANLAILSAIRDGYGSSDCAAHQRGSPRFLDRWFAMGFSAMTNVATPMMSARTP